MSMVKMIPEFLSFFKLCDSTVMESRSGDDISLSLIELYGNDEGKILWGQNKWVDLSPIEKAYGVLKFAYSSMFGEITITDENEDSGVALYCMDSGEFTVPLFIYENGYKMGLFSNDYISEVRSKVIEIATKNHDLRLLKDNEHLFFIGMDNEIYNGYLGLIYQFSN